MEEKINGKSIKGITDEKAAKAAAEMFKGNWIDAKNKCGKACKAYVIDDCDREKYIERSVLVNMTLLRKTAAAKAMTGAILRVIRALTGMKCQYTKKELQKPFAIPRVTFSPDYTDPEVRKAMLSQGMNSIGSLFGATPNIVAIPDTLTGGERDEFNPEEFADNPAFASDEAMVEENAGGEQNWFDETPQQNSESEANEQTGYICNECGAQISDKVYSYSINKFGKPLCVRCQRGAH